jgi:hypothetical protein
MVDGQRIDVWVERPADAGTDEGDIAAWQPDFEQALDGLMGVVRAVGRRLRDTDAEVVTVEFGCEFAVESGSFIAVIGKASGQSSVKVQLQWQKPA